MPADENVEQWLPLIRYLARQQVMLSQSYEFDDRVQDGLLAAWRAMKSYDAVKYPGVPLSAWVTMKVKRYMLDGSLRESRNRRTFLEDEGLLAGDYAEPYTPPQLRIDPIEEAFAALDYQRLPERVRAAIQKIRHSDVVIARLNGQLLREYGAEHNITESGAQLRWKKGIAELKHLLIPPHSAASPAPCSCIEVLDEAEWSTHPGRIVKERGRIFWRPADCPQHGSA